MYSKDGVRQERSGWRDEWISERHRHWGYNCPAVDVDFVMVEYNQGTPVALVEYKADGNTYVARNMNHPTLKAIRILADNSKIPFLLVSYAKDPSWFRLTPANSFARKRFAAPVVMSEREYVGALYALRHMKLPDDLAQQLNGYKPQEQPPAQVGRGNTNPLLQTARRAGIAPEPPRRDYDESDLSDIPF